MKTNNALFHKGAYKDAMKQLSLPMFLATFLLIVAHLFLALYADNCESTTFSGFRTVSFQLMSIPMSLVFLVVAPAMVLYLSQYMMKRSASDLYNAFPVRKESLVFSNLMSVLTCSVIMLVTGTILTEILVAFSKHLSFGNANDWYMVLPAYVAAVIYMSGAMYLALAITGNVTSTFIAFMMLVFIPRLSVTIWAVLVETANHTISYSLTDTILDEKLNVVIGLFSGPIFHDSFQNIQIKSIVFTLMLGLIYCIIALIAHKKRPAEAAGYSAISEKWQAILRTVLACFVSILPVIFISNNEDGSREPETIYAVIMLYVLTVLVYFGYEIFTTRKLKASLKKAPGLLAVLAFNLVFIFSIKAGQSAIANDFPDSEKAGDISICLDTQRYFKHHGLEDYYAFKMNEYMIKDPAVRDMICESMKAFQKYTVLALSGKGSLNGSEIEKFYNEIYIEDKNDMNNMIRIEVRVSGGTAFKNREIEIPVKLWRQLLTKLETDASFKAIFTSPIPESDIAEIRTSHNAISSALGYEEYADLVQDYSENDFSSIVEMLTSIADVFDYPSYEITTKEGLSQTVMITPNTPKSYMDHLKQHSDKMLLSEKLKAMADKTPYSDKSGEGYIRKALLIRFFNVADGEEYREFTAFTDPLPGASMTWSIYTSTDERDDNRWEEDVRTRENITSLNDMILKQQDTEVSDMNAPYMKVEYRVYYDDMKNIDIIEDSSAYLALDPATVEWVENVSKK